MAYVVTAHKPTAVSHAVTGPFTDPDDISLVVAKSSRLEVHRLTPDGIALVHDVPVYGKIVALQLFRVPGETQDRLFMLTERYHYAMIKRDTDRRELVTLASGSAAERVGRPAEGGQAAIVDPLARCIVLHIYEGVLKVFPLGARGQMREAFNVRLEEPEVLAIAFLHNCEVPTLAVLYQDSGVRRRVKTLKLGLREKEATQGPWKDMDCEQQAEKLVAVPRPVGGVLVFGHHTVSYLKEGICKAVPVPAARFVAAAPVDQEGGRFLAGDHSGRLHVVVLTPDSSGKAIDSLHVDTLGETSSASCIAYLDAGVVFVGSRFGDSQLVRLLDEPSEDNGDYVEPVQAMTNLGPIMDMCVVDIERQGQGQVVTCSGGYKDGSLRVVRNGIGINEQASIELPGIKGMWSLRASTAARHDRYLVQSFISETRILGILGDEMEETAAPGFLAGRTLLVHNVGGDLVLQVGEAGVALVEADGLERVAEWRPPAGLAATVAAANEARVIMACGGGHLFHLEVDLVTRSITESARVTLEHEVACLSVNPAANTSVPNPPDADGDPMAVDEAEGGGGSAAAAAAAAASTAKELDMFVAVGMWTDNTVRLLALPALTPVLSQPLGGDVQARSVLLATLHGCHYLLVGLGDGHLVHFVVELAGNAAAGAAAAAAAGQIASLHTQKKVALGTQPLGLTCFRNNGTACVFVSGDRPTVVHASPGSASSSGGGYAGAWSGYGKLQYDNVNLGEVACVCSFDAESFPDCLALANEGTLMIGTIDDMQKLHVRNVPLGEMPRRICHSEGGRLFAVVTTTYRTPPAAAAAAAAAASDADAEAEEEGGEEEEQGMVRFVDDATFDPIYDHPLDPTETGLSAAACRFGSGDVWYVAVGTAYVNEEEQDPSAGRILVFAIEGLGEERRVQLVAEARTTGAVYCLGGMEGDRLLAGVNSRVCLYRWRRKSGADGRTYDLSLSSSIRSQVLALFLETRGHFVLVGDLMRSVTLLAVTPEAEGGGLREIARDYDAKWMAAVAVLDDDNFVGAEFDGNLFAVRKNAGAPTDEERARLEQRGEFHLGEVVNRFAQGSLVMLQPQMMAAAAGMPKTPSAADHPAGPASSSGEAWGVTLAGQTLLFGTVSGSIGAILPLPESSYVWFDRLQRAMQAAAVGKGVGETVHADWRSISTTRRVAPASRFVDGDLVEIFLELKRDEQEQIVVTMLERLSREDDPAAAADDDAMAPLSGAPAAASGASATSAASAAAASSKAAAIGPGAAEAAALLAVGKEPPPGALARAVDQVLRRVEEISRMH